MNAQAYAAEFLDNGYLEDVIAVWDESREDNYDDSDLSESLLEDAWWEIIIPDDDYDVVIVDAWLDSEYYSDSAKVVIINDPYWAYSIKEAGIIDLPEGATIVSHDYFNGATVSTATLTEAITVDVLNIRTNYNYSVADCCGDNSNFMTEKDDN